MADVYITGRIVDEDGYGIDHAFVSLFTPVGWDYSGYSGWDSVWYTDSAGYFLMGFSMIDMPTPGETYILGASKYGYSWPVYTFVAVYIPYGQTQYLGTHTFPIKETLTFYIRECNYDLGNPVAVESCIISSEYGNFQYSGSTFQHIDKKGNTLQITCTYGGRQRYFGYIFDAGTGSSIMSKNQSVALPAQQGLVFEHDVYITLNTGNVSYSGRITRNSIALANHTFDVELGDNSNGQYITPSFTTDSDGNYLISGTNFDTESSSPTVITLKPRGNESSDGKCCFSISISGKPDPPLAPWGCITWGVANHDYEGRPAFRVSMPPRPLLGSWSYSGGFVDGDALSTLSDCIVVIKSEQKKSNGCYTSDARKVKITHEGIITDIVDISGHTHSSVVPNIYAGVRDVTNIQNDTGTTDVSISVYKHTGVSNAIIYVLDSGHNYTDLSSFDIGSSTLTYISFLPRPGGIIRGLVTSDINGTCTVSVTGQGRKIISAPGTVSFTGTCSNLQSGDTFTLSPDSPYETTIEYVTSISTSGTANSGAFKIQADKVYSFLSTDAEGYAGISGSSPYPPSYPGTCLVEIHYDGKTYLFPDIQTKLCGWYEDIILMNLYNSISSIRSIDNSLILVYSK